MNESLATIKRVHNMTVAGVYPFYVQKVEKKGRTKAEVNEVMCWLTGYSQSELDNQLAKQTTFEEFFNQAPQMNPNRKLITGVICGVRVEEIKDDIYREARYLDKLVDELAKGKPMDKILRSF